MPLPAVQTSAYIGGITDSTCSHRPVEPDDVALRRQGGCAFPGLARRPEVEARQAVGLHHQREAGSGHGDHLGRAVDHRPHRRVARADHLVVGDEGTQPVREVDDLRAGDAGEEVLVPAREADHLVREHRPADDELVVVEDAAVQRHRHILREAPAGELRDLGGGNRAEVREHRRVVPLVVVDARLADAPADDFGTDELRQRRVVHRLVRTQRDQEVDRARLAGEQLAEQREHPRHRHRARAVRDDEQHALAVERERGEAVAHDGAGLVVGQVAVLEALSDHVRHCKRGAMRVAPRRRGHSAVNSPIAPHIRGAGRARHSGEMGNGGSR